MSVVLGRKATMAVVMPPPMKRKSVTEIIFGAAVANDGSGESDVDISILENNLLFRRRSLEKDSVANEIKALGVKQPLRRRNSIGAPKIADNGPPLSLAHSNVSFRRVDSMRMGGTSSKVITGQKVRDVLYQPQCCSLFKDFLDKESASQTLLFLLEVEEYRRIPTVDFQQVRAKKIFNKFLHSLAIMPVPISQQTQDNIVLELLVMATPSIFSVAAEEVLAYIEETQFPRFQQSAEMNKVVNILTQEAGATKPKRRTSICGDVVQICDVNNLRQLLQFQISTRFFKDFCMRAYVNESLFFWLDAENYTNLPGSDYMRRTAFKICRKYIFEKAKLQINISHATKVEIMKGLVQPGRDLFKRAQGEIFKLLEQDAYPKFLLGPEHELMLKCIQASASAKKGKTSSIQKALSWNR